MAHGIRTPKFDTIAVHGAAADAPTGSGDAGSVIEPIVASTAQAFASAQEMEDALAYRTPAWAYSRIHNPTIGQLERTLALLECYGTECSANALATASGMAAIAQAIEPLLSLKHGAAPNFAIAAQVYGGTFQLCNVRMPERGATPRWIRRADDAAEWEAAIDEGTRFLFVETPSNPLLGMVDLRMVADIADRHDIPLVVDSTLASPALLRPFAHGADIVVHSLTKIIGSNGTAVGGALIARRGIRGTYLPNEVTEDFAGWCKLYPFRDTGPCMSPQTAHEFLSQLRTLRARVRDHSRNAMRIADFLARHLAVSRVHYPGLRTHPGYPQALHYLRLADSGEPLFGHLLSFEPKGGVEEARRCFDRLRLIMRATDLGRVKSVAAMPAISTHQQQGAFGRALAGIPAELIRLSVGAEDPEDLMADLDQALRP